MKHSISVILAAMMLSLGFSGTAVAEDDMDVTMEMVRDDESLRDLVVHEMMLPPSASETGREASEKGREQAREARQKAEEARDRGREAREQRGRQMDFPDRADRPGGADRSPPSTGESHSSGRR